MLFEDPIRSISVELPAGWVYSLFESTLTDFYFTLWDRPSELIGVHVRPASVSDDSPDEKWIQQIQSQISDKAVLNQIACATGCALSADFGSEAGPAQRVVFIRGPKVELVVEQRSMEPQSDRWAPLEQAVQTIFSPVNVSVLQQSGVEEFNQFMESANQAFAKQDYSAVVAALQQALEVGTSAWLYSLAPPVNSPDVNAAVRVAQTMTHLSSFTRDALMQRNSESVLRRALYTLERMGGSSDGIKKLKADLMQTLDMIAAELLEGTEEKAAGSLSPVIAMRERGLRAANVANEAFNAADFENAHNLSCLASEDLLSLISILRRPQSQSQEIPPEIASHLASQGIIDPAAQRETLQKARESLLFPPIVVSLQIRYSSALRLGNFGFSEAASLLLPIAQLLHKDNPGEVGIAMNLALAWMLCAGTSALQSGDQSLDNAEQYIASAANVLESITDSQGADGSWIQNHDRHFEGILLALDRRLALFEKSENEDAVKRLQSIRDRFEKLASEFRTKVGAGGH